MCPLSYDIQNKAQPLFAVATDTTFDLDAPFPHQMNQEKKECFPLTAAPLLVEKEEKNRAQKRPFLEEEDRLFHKKRKGENAPKNVLLECHKSYLKKRIEESDPEWLPGAKLCKEITAQGYKGTCKTVYAFLAKVRGTQNGPKEGSLPFYRDYLKMRLLEESESKLPSKELFKEITAKGYRGPLNSVQSFLAKLRKESGKPQEISLPFYRDYLKTRLETSGSKLSGKELFKEITAKGYRGSLRTVQTFLTTMRKQAKRPKEEFLPFYRDYLKTRLGESESKLPSRQLFEEITAKGYRGPLNSMQTLLAAMRKQTNRPKEEFLLFYKSYLTEKVEQSYPKHVSVTHLFEEIRAKGYRGTPSAVRAFLAVVRKKYQERHPERSLQFYMDYLTQRVNKAYPKYPSSSQLFKEITAKGYRGTRRSLQTAISLMRKKKPIPKVVYLEFHKDYLREKINGSSSKYISGNQLFEEIKAKGYRGSLKRVQAFLTEVRKQNRQKVHNECLKLRKDCPYKRRKRALPQYASSKTLFGKMQAKRCPEALKKAKKILSKAPKEGIKSGESLHFQKEYLIKRLEETWPGYLSPRQLFKEMTSRGYRGSLKEIEVLLTMI